MDGVAGRFKVARQQTFKFHDQVPNEPLSQGVIRFACKKPQLIQPIMKVFGRFAHLTALLRGQSHVTEACFWNFKIFRRWTLVPLPKRTLRAHQLKRFSSNLYSPFVRAFIQREGRLEVPKRGSRLAAVNRKPILLVVKQALSVD
jgi:hypothetical protein